MSSYVALTRVRSREDVLIYRPFEQDFFTCGSLEGPDLVLKVLRGEEVDWKAIEESHTPRRLCVECGFRFQEERGASQFGRHDGRRICKACVAAKGKAGTPVPCTTCLLWKPAQAFGKNVQHMRVERRVCQGCEERRRCSG